jgi:hypothetical protein
MPHPRRWRSDGSGSSQPASPVEPCQMTDEAGAGAGQAHGVGLVLPRPRHDEGPNPFGDPRIPLRRSPTISLMRLRCRPVRRKPFGFAGIRIRHHHQPPAAGRGDDRRSVEV